MDEDLKRILDVVEKSPEKFERILENILPTLNSMLSDDRREKYQVAKEFLDAANEDLMASQVLYSSNLYPSAVFHLQQAVEKYLKAILIYYFRLSKKEVRSYISHDSPKVTTLLLKKRNYRDLIRGIASFADIILKKDHPVNFSEEYVNKLEKLLNKSKRSLAKMSSQEITALVNTARKLVENLEGVETKKRIENVIDWMRELIDNLDKVNETERREIMDVVDRVSERVDVALKLSSSLAILILLGIITYPHANYARYPSKRLFEYKSGLGVVDCLNDLLKLLEIAAKNLNLIFKVDAIDLSV